MSLKFTNLRLYSNPPGADELIIMFVQHPLFYDRHVYQMLLYYRVCPIIQTFLSVKLSFSATFVNFHQEMSLYAICNNLCH